MVAGGSGGDFALARYDLAYQRAYAQTDANYDVTAITGPGGVVLERYGYDPYGGRTVLEADFSGDGDGLSDYGFAHGFQGGKADGATGLIHFGAREYSPTLGRWMQQDPAGYVDGMSVYEALRSAPTGHSDPSGLDAYVDIGEGHAGALVDVRDKDGCLVAILRADFRAKKKHPSNAFVGGWNWIQLVTYTQGQVDLVVKKPEKAFFKQSH